MAISVFPPPQDAPAPTGLTGHLFSGTSGEQVSANLGPGTYRVTSSHANGKIVDATGMFYSVQDPFTTSSGISAVRLGTFSAGLSSFTARTSNLVGGSQAYCAGSGGGFLLIGNDVGSVSVSSNGTTFTNRGAPASLNWTDHTYGNGIHVLSNGTTYYTSPDTITWTLRTGVTTTQGLAYGAGLFVAVGNSGGISTSPDAVTWTARTSGTSNTLRKVRFANSIFIAVGDNGTIVTSPDGITWTTRTSGTTQPLYGVGYGRNFWFAAAGNTGGNHVYSLNNGATWTTTSFYTSELYGVAGNGDAVITGGNNGTAYVSTNGTTWTNISSASGSSWIRSAASGLGYMLFAGQSNFVSTAEYQAAIGSMTFQPITQITV